MVATGRKRPQFTILRGEKPESPAVLLKGKFSTSFRPISAFLSRRNAFEVDSGPWFSEERKISRDFAMRVLEVVPELKALDRNVILMTGLPTCLGVGENPESLPSDSELLLAYLSGFKGEEKTARWGLIGILVLLDRMEEQARDSAEFSSAALGVFQHIRAKIDTYVKVSQLSATRSPIPDEITADDLIDENSGVHQSWFVRLLDGLAVSFAYHRNFDLDVFETLTLDWRDIPSSMAYNSAGAVFSRIEAENSTFMRNVIRRISQFNHGELQDGSQGMRWLEAFRLSISNPGDSPLPQDFNGSTTFP